MALSAVQRKHLQELSGVQLYCKARRRHRFPPMVPGRPLPSGVTVERVAGVYQVKETCELCGRHATRTAGRNGVIDYQDVPRYGGGGPGYLAPKGAGMSLAMYQDELASEQSQMVKDAAKLVEVETTPERRATKDRIAELREGDGMPTGESVRDRMDRVNRAKTPPVTPEFSSAGSK